MPDGYSTASGRSISESLGAMAEAAKAKLGRAIYREALGIMAESQGLVPVGTGALRSSGYVTEPQEVEDGVIRVTLGYGGPAAQINPKTGESTDAYALFVHENLEAFHKVGTAKFLEMPFDQAAGGMAARIAVEVRFVKSFGS